MQREPISSHVFIEIARVWAEETRAATELRQAARRKAGLKVTHRGRERHSQIVGFYDSKRLGTIDRSGGVRRPGKAWKKRQKRMRQDVRAGRAPF